MKRNMMKYSALFMFLFGCIPGGIYASAQKEREYAEGVREAASFSDFCRQMYSRDPQGFAVRLSVLLYVPRDQHMDDISTADAYERWSRVIDLLKICENQQRIMDPSWIDTLRLLTALVLEARESIHGEVCMEPIMASRCCRCVVRTSSAFLQENQQENCYEQKCSCVKRGFKEEEQKIQGQIRMACIHLDFMPGAIQAFPDFMSTLFGDIAVVVSSKEQGALPVIDSFCSILRKRSMSNHDDENTLCFSLKVRFDDGARDNCCIDNCNCGTRYQGNCPCAVLETCVCESAA